MIRLSKKGPHPATDCGFFVVEAVL
jgi:hypothetical protein